jgi:hypothetical protein
MNWNRFLKNAGMRVQIEPPACRLDSNSHVLPECHDDWLIEQFLEGEVAQLQNLSTGHVIKLGKDHIYDFRSNPARSENGIPYGFLVLKVQVFLQGAEAWVRPNGRPGERVPPSNVPHHQVLWTPYFHVDTGPFAPPTATAISIQYRLWSDEPGVPLLIRVASNPDGTGITQELSGPSGVLDQMLTSPNLYVSLSNPRVQYELRALGWKDAL